MREEGGEVETEEQVGVLPEAVAEVEVGCPGSVAPVAAAAVVASWPLPAAPTESGPAAASAERRSLTCTMSVFSRSVISL